MSEPKGPEYVTFARVRRPRWGDYKVPFQIDVTTLGERVGGVLFTVRRARWLKGYLQALAEGASGESAVVRGARLAGIGGSRTLSDLVVQKKMEGFLALPDVKEAMRNIYAAGADFDLTDAVKMHRRHMDGLEVEQQTVTKEGEVVTYTQTIPPSWPALKDYLDRTTPKEATKMHVLTARANVVREVRTDGSPPPMSARSIGDIVDP